MSNQPIPENEPNQENQENQSETDNILWFITSNVDLSTKMTKEIRLALIKRELYKKYDGLKTKAEIEAMFEKSITHLDSQGKPKKVKPKSVSRSKRQGKKKSRNKRKRKRKSKMRK